MVSWKQVTLDEIARDVESVVRSMGPNCRCFCNPTYGPLTRYDLLTRATRNARRRRRWARYA